MATIVLRANKGEALSFEELDNNFDNLNTELVSKVQSVSGSTNRIVVGGTAVAPTVDLQSGIATAGTTGSSSLIPVITVDTYGRITGVSTAANPQGTVTSISTGTGLSGGTITSSGTISLSNTGVTAGTYTGRVTVDSQGRITTATNSLIGYNEGTVYDLGTLSSGTPTLNIANGNVQKITLANNWVFQGFSSAVTGQSVTLLITQDGTGGRTFTTTSITAKWAAGAIAGNKTLTTTANALDILYIFYDGTQYLFTLNKGFV